MKIEKESSYIEKNPSKLPKLSSIKETNKFGKLNTSYKSNFSEKAKNISLNMSFSKVGSIRNNNRKSVLYNKGLFSNNLGFVPHFGKGFIKKNNDVKNNLNITNSFSNHFINNTQEMNDSESSDKEKNLKCVEKEIKNKLKDMTFIMQDNNKSFHMDYKWKDIDNFSIEEEDYKKRKKKKKKKKKNKSLNVDKKNQIIDKDRKIVHKPPLYDSLDEEEIQGDDDLDNIFINPEGNFILVFDIIVFIASFISFLYTPLQIARSKCFCIDEHIIVDIIFFLIDLVFVFDLFISFFRAFYNYEYKLIKDTKLIIKHYLKSNFLFDFLEAIPFNIMINYFCFYKEKYKPDGPFCLYNGINGIYSSIKLLSGLKLLKILKVMNKKKNRLYKFLKEIDNHLFENIISIFTFVFLSLASMNVFICIHIFIGNQSYPNWLLAMGIHDLPFIQIYIAALYGIIETLTTVGYGDVVTNSFTEICFQIILLSVGIVAYSWLITIIGNYVKNESKAEIKHSKDLTTLEEIRIDYPTMSFKLYNKIHQHLNSVSNQQKKVDLNILVNSLPYSIKNMLLFRIYHRYIRKFNFFKRCDNTDFISRVLTNFIPLFSKQKALLIHEGEFIENIFFVKTGKLSLDAALDIYEPEDSINSYLYEKFNDIIEKENKSETHINNEIKESLNPQTNQIDKMNTGIQNIFNQKKQSIADNSYHESRIEQEIGKCDLGGSDDFEEGNCKFLCIMSIKRNENFGITYMQLNKPCPLSLRVKSKKADIFILRKLDVIHISKAYPSIWKKISENALHNMIAIKDKAFSILKNYCSYHGLLLDNKPKKRDKVNPFNLLEIKELMELEKKKNEEQKTIDSKNKKLKEKAQKKKSIQKKKYYNTQIIKEQEIIENIKKKLINKKYYNSKSLSPFLSKIVHNKTSCKLNLHNFNFDQKSFKDNLDDKFQLSNNKTIKEEECNNEMQISNSKSIKEDKNSELKLSNSNAIKEDNNKKNDVSSTLIIDEGKNIKENDNNNIKEIESLANSNNILDNTDKLYKNENDKNYPNTLSNLSPVFSSFLKKKIIKKKNKSKHYYKQLCLKLTEALNNVIKNNNAKNEFEYINNNISSVNNCNPLIFKNNNYLISNSNLIIPITDNYRNNYDLMSSASKTMKSDAFVLDKLIVDKNDSFQYKSIYNNLNKISNGNYEKNKKMQKETEDFIKEYNQKKKNIIKTKTPTITKKKNKDISFSLSLGNISEIKSNSSFHNSINSKTNQIQINESRHKKILKKNHDSSKSKNKNKKLKFSIPNKNEIDKNLIINNSTNNKETLLININSNNNYLNLSEPSESKNINHKNSISGNERKIFNYDKKKSKTFINKMFIKKKKEKQNINKSQSKEFLYESSIFNPETGLRNNTNFEELRNKTLKKLNTYNQENIKTQKLESNKSVSFLEEDKTNKNCKIF